MQTLLHFILENIVDYPEDIIINSSEDQYGNLILDVSVNPEDMGKVIGKNGKIISSIRKLLKVKAMKLGKRFQFNLIDPLQRD